ncbi:MAG TPA: VWA domain-containing protein [Acidimicrobiia bacterium]|nr:VWA domain-containing protein [Acidimicrobiia bacterium]
MSTLIDGSTARLVEFGRALRAGGIPVPPTIARDLVAALEHVGAGSAEDVYWAFRGLTVTARDQIPIFDRVFIEFFRETDWTGLSFTQATTPRTWAIDQVGGAEGEGDGDAEDVSVAVGASAVERLADKDFALLTPDEEQRVKTMINQMLWNPAVVRARRRAPATTGDVPDLRRSMRAAVGPSGDMMRLSMTTRTVRKRPVIVIADVSGSMERYSEMLLYFAHAARERFGKLEAFVFSTRLTRITRELARRKPADAIAAVADHVHDWSGGTQIGESLRTFNRDWSRRVCRGSPVAIVISDGWDRGDPELLAREMDRLQRTVYRTVWLNPLAGREGYAPETQGMRAALPFVDDFLAAGTLRDLRTLVRLLESVGTT